MRMDKKSSIPRMLSVLVNEYSHIKQCVKSIRDLKVRAQIVATIFGNAYLGLEGYIDRHSVTMTVEIVQDTMKRMDKKL